MSTIQEIASKVQDPANTWETRHARNTEPGKAQQQVLATLGLTANNFAHAEAIFETIGISVSHRREGRRSVPVVNICQRGGDAYRNDYGDYDVAPEWSNATDLDLSALNQWMER